MAETERVAVLERDGRSDEANGDVVELHNPQGTAPVLLVCEHASAAMPAEFADLGLAPRPRKGHIAWDPGALGVAREMARLIDAPLVAHRFSRLLYDCNRPPEAPDAIPVTSEIHRIPGNEGLMPEARLARIERFYLPFRAALSAELDRLAGRDVAPVLVTVHTFTPVYFGARRDVAIGLLHDRDHRLADEMLRDASSWPVGPVRRNEPYGPQHGVTHTLKEHALTRGLLNVMIEVRNDLVATRAAQASMADELAARLAAALGRLGVELRAPAGGAS